MHRIFKLITGRGLRVLVEFEPPFQTDVQPDLTDDGKELVFSCKVDVTDKDIVSNTLQKILKEDRAGLETPIVNDVITNLKIEMTPPRQNIFDYRVALPFPVSTSPSDVFQFRTETNKKVYMYFIPAQLSSARKRALPSL